MSRRRGDGRPAEEVIVTCRACGDSRMVARFHLDSDGDPVLTRREGSEELSWVEPFELVDGRLVHTRSDQERRVPRYVTVTCADGHPIKLLSSTLLEVLSARPGRVAL